MMSSESDQRSSTNLLGLHEFQLCRQHFAIFQEDQLNFRKFPVFPGAVDIPLKKWMVTVSRVVAWDWDSLVTAIGDETR